MIFHTLLYSLLLADVASGYGLFSQTHTSLSRLRDFHADISCEYSLL